MILFLAQHTQPGSLEGTGITASVTKKMAHLVACHYGGILHFHYLGAWP